MSASSITLKGQRIVLPPITRCDRRDRVPLSYAQERLWVLAQMEGVSDAYHLPVGLRLKGELHSVALQAALDTILARHEVLRTTFASVQGEFVQKIGPVGHFPLIEHDLRNEPSAQETLRTLIATESRTRFDLQAGPLIRGRLVRQPDDEYTLLITMHHIVSDAWSIGVLLNELCTLYGAYLHRGKNPLPELAVQYADYAVWQRQWIDSNLIRDQAQYWKSALAGAPTLLELPTDYPRPSQQDFTGGYVPLVLDKKLKASLKELGRRHGATLYMTLLAAWALLLSRLSGQRDVTIGTPVANRGRVETRNLIGLFVNTLVLRVNLSASITVAELLARVKREALAAQQHQDIPFEQVVTLCAPVRSLSHNPLFQTMFFWQNTPDPSLAFPGLEVTPLTSLAYQVAKLDLSLLLQETADTITGGLEYATALFERSTVERYAQHFITLLQGMVADDTQSAELLPLLPVSDRERILDQWNAARVHYPSARSPLEPREERAGKVSGAKAMPLDNQALTGTDRVPDTPTSTCLHELFERQVERVPASQIAVLCEDEEITYHELNHRANQLARHLRTLGAEPETLVAICVERGVDMMVGLLGILKAGAAYVPCDPLYPAERISHILEDAVPPILVTQQHLLDQLTATFRGASILCLDRDWPEISRQERSNPNGLAGPQTLAYVMYTSGSTGKPKGISIAHSSTVSYMFWAREMFSPEDLHGVLASTSICFDISLIELFIALSWGGRIIMAQNALQLPELRNRNQVTLINTVPSAMRELVAVNGLPQSVRSVILGGEAVDPAVATEVYKHPNVQRVFNFYGPTEDTIYSTWSLLPKKADKAPIGRSMTGKQAYVLDQRLQLVPVGITGSIYLAGDGLARGYRNRPDLTAEKFIPNPFSKQPGARMYDTGDLARWNNYGELEYIGRSDQQVKIRGFRIELGEVESILQQHPGVRQAVALVREDVPGDKLLVAYVVEKEKNAVKPADLRSFVKQKLPQYMVPSAVVVMDAFPLTQNGKLNRKALPAPEVTPMEQHSGYVAPRTRTEETLGNIFGQVLNLQQVGVEDNFFEIGGHSLRAVQVVARVRDAFEIELPVRKLFENPTVAGLAEVVDRLDRAAAKVQSPRITRVPRDGPLPLSFSEETLRLQERLSGGRATFNVVLATRLIGELDRQALEKSISQIALRHEILRTTFKTVGGHAVRHISEPINVPVAVADFQISSTNGKDELSNLVAQESRTPFHVGRGPVFRVKLVRISEQEHVLLFTVPHIIADGWSAGIIIQELEMLYESFRKQEAATLPELPVQYADYAAWIRNRMQGELLDKLTSYWNQKLKGLSGPIALPGISRQAASGLSAVRSISFYLSPAESDALRKFSKREGVTLFVTLLAAFKLLIHRLTNAQDIVVVLPTSERSHSELEGVVGLFMNFLFVRTGLSGELSFRDVLDRVQKSSTEASEHQELPFGILLKSLRSEQAGIGESLFQFGFNYLNLPVAGAAPSGLRSEVVHSESGSEWLSDLTLHVSDNNETLHLYVVGKEALLATESMADIVQQLKSILTGICAEVGIAEGTLAEAVSQAAVLQGAPIIPRLT